MPIARRRFLTGFALLALGATASCKKSTSGDAPSGAGPGSKATGDIVRIFRGDDLDSLGGALFATPDKLVTVSNVGITAYARGARAGKVENP